MSDGRIVLASGSPRRRALLELLGVRFEIQAADVEEVQEPGEGSRAFAERAARDKATAVAGSGGPPVLAADTVVELDGETLGKPSCAEDARQMLERLSGTSHHVHTAMALAVAGECHSLVDTASVRFVHLTPGMIEWYIASGEPMDKAGAYAVQGRAGLFVAEVHGSPHTVVGLPIHRLGELLERGGLSLWDVMG